ncbi:MAG: alkane 1-monooxygenase [Bacteroidia bacterium]|jgi:alkane 1-monooxygenase|nr:alkane 1-monooxygenase [Bacteroidia bacterium]
MNITYGLRYTVALLPGILAVAGGIAEPVFHYVNCVWILIVLVLLDWVVPPRHDNPPDNQWAVIPDGILYLASALHLAAIALLLYRVWQDAYTLWQLNAAIASVGLNAGISGIVVAHELIHRKNAAERFLGQFNLFVVNYTHFYIEHVRGHHRTVGTPEDPATARLGESVYAFIVRTVPGQWYSALKLEAAQLRKAGNAAYGLRNYVVRAGMLQLAACAALGWWLGGTVLAVYLGITAIGIIQLEYVNYIEHYGLMREPGRKVEAQHSWQSDAPGSRLTLIELSRHADHHMKASKPYHTLVTHQGGPVLNSGYFGMFYITLIPPLWFRMVHPRMQEAGVYRPQ